MDPVTLGKQERNVKKNLAKQEVLVIERVKVTSGEIVAGRVHRK